jgi:SAM-dependent methyltransferase
MPMSHIVHAAESLAFIHEAVAAAAAIAAADRLGVLARLRLGPVDSTTLARDCAISERGASLLLAALAGLGLVEATSGRGYRPLDQPLRLVELLAQFRQLEAAVRDGKTILAADVPAKAGAFYPDVVPVLAHIVAPAAERAAEHLARPGLRVLDVGAGAAPWSLALARRDPACRVTAVDLPAVLTATRQAVVAAGCTAQFTFVGGDLFTVDWSPHDYDLAIAGNVCHLFDELTNRRLLGRLLHALRPLGRLAVIDVVPNEGLDGPRSVVLYALGLLLRTRAGRVYPFSTYVGWLRDAGLQAVERLDLATTPALSVITAQKPG